MRPDVLVVGGGLAGLSAAVHAASRGARVKVMEARSVCGGRATSFTTSGEAMALDNGQHALMGCYHETWRLLDIIGSRHLVPCPASLTLTMVERDGRRTTLQCPAWPSPWHLVGGVMGWRALPRRERLAVGRLGPAILRATRAMRGAGPWPVREAESVRDWLERHGQGPRAIALLWEPLAVAALNQAIHVAGAAPFVRVLAQLLGPLTSDAAVVVPSVPLSEVFAEPAVNWLTSHGHHVDTNVLARVEVANGRAQRILRRGVTPIDVEPDQRVIVATPWHALSRVIVGDTRGLQEVLDAAASLRPVSIVTVYLWFADRPVDVPMIGLEGRTFQWIFAREGYLSLVRSDADSILRKTNDALVADALADVRHALPRARSMTPVRARVVREPLATFSVEPGQRARPGVATSVANLRLAGDWVDTGLPATIEGAVLSGRLAAESDAR